MATAIDSGIGTLNYGRQTAKGTKATAATTSIGYDRPKWHGGGLSPNKTTGSKEYVDGQRFASPTTYTDKVGGEVGSVTLQLQPENVGLYPAQILGVDVVTGASDPYTHTSTSAAAAGLWGTWWQKVGANASIQRELYWDSKIGKAVLTSNFADKVLLAELSILALVSGEVFTTDAAKTEVDSDAYLHTEASGAFTLDGTVIREVNEAVTTIDARMGAYWGDDIAPLHLIDGKGLISQSMAAIGTDETLAKYRKAIYGTATPTAGNLPVKAVFNAATSIVYTRSATRTFTITCPRVEFDPGPMKFAPQPEGGPLPIQFSGTCCKSGATPAITTVTLSGDATTYA